MPVSQQDAAKRLASMTRLKEKGNKEYKGPDKASVAKSAVTYGELIQEMMDFEQEYNWVTWDSEQIVEVFTREQLSAFETLKPVAFLNLAASNLKLEGYEGCRRCCNAALLFVNKPSLQLIDMGADTEGEADDAGGGGGGGAGGGGGGGGDITGDVQLMEPVRPDLCTLAAKAMYRRALSMHAMLRHSSGSRASTTHLGTATARADASVAAAISGIEAALRVAPQAQVGDKAVGSAGLRADLTALLTTLQEERQQANDYAAQLASQGDWTGGSASAAGAGAGASVSNSETEGVAVLHAAVLDGMQVNGGRCAKRQGFWSQTVDTCTVYLPLCLLCGSASNSNSSSGSSSGCKMVGGGKGKALEQHVPLPANFQRAELEVTLDKAEVRIDYMGEVVLHSVLEYNMQPGPKAGAKARAGASGSTNCAHASTWTLESPYTERRVGSNGDSDNGVTGQVLLHKDGPPSHLVLHVMKIPSLEWYPGCEWWDRIFVDDEAIDTTFCKVDAGSSGDLPQEARQRALQEHARFSGQTQEEQQVELAGLAKMKSDFNEALQRHDAQQQRGLQEQDGREEMLDAMSAEFPNIFFGTK